MYDDCCLLLMYILYDCTVASEFYFSDSALQFLRTIRMKMLMMDAVHFFLEIGCQNNSFLSFSLSLILSISLTHTEHTSPKKPCLNLTIITLSAADNQQPRDSRTCGAILLLWRSTNKQYSNITVNMSSPRLCTNCITKQQFCLLTWSRASV